MKRFIVGVLLLAAITVWAGAAMASEPVEGAKGVKGEGAASGAAFFFGMTVLAAGLGIGIGTLATGIGQGFAVGKAVEGISRQPESAGTIQTVMIIGLAFIESLTIYVLLISLILLFVNPYAKLFQ